MKSREQIDEIIHILKELYPVAMGSLKHRKDYELLVSLRLAAQCTDARVAMVTPRLFEKYPTLQALAEAEVSDVEEIIRSCGFFHSKAKDIVNCARALIENYGGKVPDTMEELLKLPGVGRKSANLVLGDIFGQPAFVVDTHCIRITNLLGIVDNTKDPYKIELKLREVIPPEESSDFCHRLVLHGRAVCIARRPQCENCRLSHLCSHFSGGSAAAQ